MDPSDSERTDDGFFGSQEGRFDDKNRIALPSKIRKEAVGVFALRFYYVTPRANLCVVSSREWRRLNSRFEFYGITNPDVEVYRTLMMDMSGDVVIDTQGRMVVREELLPLIGIDKKNRDAKISGGGGIINIWSLSRLEDFKSGERLVLNDTFRQYQEAGSRLVL